MLKLISLHDLYSNALVEVSVFRRVTDNKKNKNKNKNTTWITEQLNTYLLYITKRLTHKHKKEKNIFLKENLF